MNNHSEYYWTHVVDNDPPAVDTYVIWDAARRYVASTDTEVNAQLLVNEFNSMLRAIRAIRAMC
jgi:hypothetical protein